MFKNLMQTEPARLYLIVRSALYLVAAAGVSVLEPDLIEQILAALALVLGVDAATTEATRRKVYSPQTASDLIAGMFVGTVGGFIRDTALKLAPKGKATDALRTVLPIAAEFAQANLTPELRTQLQDRIHITLRKAGLLKGRPITPASLLILLPMTAAMILLASCAPVANLAQDVGRDIVDRTAGDQVAYLAYADTGFVFHPGPEAALNVEVQIRGLDLTTEDERCNAMPTIDELEGYACTLEDVTEPAAIEIYGLDVTATATWQRAGSSRFYQDLAE